MLGVGLGAGGVVEIPFGLGQTCLRRGEGAAGAGAGGGGLFGLDAAAFEKGARLGLGAAWCLLRLFGGEGGDGGALGLGLGGAGGRAGGGEGGLGGGNAGGARAAMMPSHSASAARMAAEQLAVAGGFPGLGGQPVALRQQLGAQILRPRQIASAARGRSSASWRRARSPAMPTASSSTWRRSSGRAEMRAATRPG